MFDEADFLVGYVSPDDISDGVASKISIKLALVLEEDIVKVGYRVGYGRGCQHTFLKIALYTIAVNLRSPQS